MTEPLRELNEEALNRKPEGKVKGILAGLKKSVAPVTNTLMASFEKARKIRVETQQLRAMLDDHKIGEVEFATQVAELKYGNLVELDKKASELSARIEKLDEEMKALIPKGRESSTSEARAEFFRLKQEKDKLTAERRRVWYRKGKVQDAGKAAERRERERRTLPQRTKFRIERTVRDAEQKYGKRDELKEESDKLYDRIANYRSQMRAISPDGGASFIDYNKREEYEALRRRCDEAVLDKKIIDDKLQLIKQIELREHRSGLARWEFSRRIKRLEGQIKLNTEKSRKEYKRVYNGPVVNPNPRNRRKTPQIY